ncbi:DNA clamp loader protein [Fragilaria crotonensis]|nr:DNA clamp loader protein [Fragilaria crotonensis]
MIAKSCTGFVDEWKVERQKALSRRADKQDRLARGRKPSKKKKLDDLWDDASDDDQAGLPSICLLTGPVGCGKTSLVYAVAKSCDCKVMEINSTDKRSSQNLKNAIEEATQSDSTIDMLKNRAAAPSVFSSRKAALVDSEDEDSDEEGSAVPIVLIDEVDLIFENEGDSGFWPTLKALAKRAKCPIFLTANVIPQALTSLSLRFKHYSLERPTPEECLSKIWQVVKSENLIHRQNLLRDHVKETLVSFAERYECDLRRVLLEMQLFTKARNSVPVSEQVAHLPWKASIHSGIPFLENEPVFEKITPNVLPVQRRTRLKIEGRGFASLSQNYSVFIGEQVCDAEVVDDNTILAACPPSNCKKREVFIHAGSRW